MFLREVDWSNIVWLKPYHHIGTHGFLETISAIASHIANIIYNNIWNTAAMVFITSTLCKHGWNDCISTFVNFDSLDHICLAPCISYLSMKYIPQFQQSSGGKHIRPVQSNSCSETRHLPRCRLNLSSLVAPNVFITKTSGVTTQLASWQLLDYVPRGYPSQRIPIPLTHICIIGPQ